MVGIGGACYDLPPPETLHSLVEDSRKKILSLPAGWGQAQDGRRTVRQDEAAAGSVLRL